MSARPGRAKIHQPHLPTVAVYDQVGRLDVVVHHGCGLVGKVLQHPADPDGVAHHLLGRQRARGDDTSQWIGMGHRTLHRLTFDVFHDDVVAPSLREVAVDARDARMAQLCQQAGLSLKAGLGIPGLVGIRGIIIVQQFLDHTVAVKGTRIGGQIEGAHPSPAQRLEDAIGATTHHVARVQGRPTRRAEWTPALFTETGARPIQVITCRLWTGLHDCWETEDWKPGDMVSLRQSTDFPTLV